MRAQVEAAAARLVIAIGEAGPAEYETIARTVGRRQVGETRPAPLGPLAQLSALGSVSSTTPLKLRPGLRPILRRGTERVTLLVIDSTISWPVQAHKALLTAVSGASFRPIDLPELDVDEQLVVARRLLREGVVITADQGPDLGRNSGG
jgi:hypothetical protein